jgi:predicted MFS family arabinose efflux permease
MSADPAALAVASPAADPRSWRGWAPKLVLFQLVYLIAYLDRQVIGLLVIPIKQSLGLSDVQIGLLQGFAFTLVLSLSSLLTARIVDKGNRVNLLAACMFVWCAMTVLSAFAQNFTMLLLTRTGLAIAEAIVPVVVLSILCDVAPRASIARASALFLMASYFGSGLALLFGGPLLGWLGAFEGTAFMGFERFEAWRGVFIIVGAPGLLLAAAMRAWMAEPRRVASVGVLASTGSGVAFFRANARFILTFMTLVAGANLVNITNYAWVPSLLTRVHGMTVPQAGLSAGTVFVAAGLAGACFGAWLMGRTRPERALQHVVAMMFRLVVLLALPLLVMPLAPSASVALLMLAISVFLLAAVLTSALTPLQLFAPSEVRGRVTAMANVYSAALSGLGPLLTGLLTDGLFGDLTMIGYSLAITYAAAVAVAIVAGGAAARMAARIENAGR